MPFEFKKAECPCCKAKLRIALILSEGECRDAWLWPQQSALFDPYNPYEDDYFDYYKEDDYDPYAESICPFCNGYCYGRCEYDAETEAIRLDAAELEAADFLNFMHGSVKAKRYDRRKKTKQKLARKRPAACRSLKPEKIAAWMAKIQPGFRFAMEPPFNRLPLKTEGEKK